MSKKPKKQDDFRPAFKGCVIIPMTDNDFDEERIRYYGDWQNPQKQHQIMKNPVNIRLIFILRGLRGSGAWSKSAWCEKMILRLYRTTSPQRAMPCLTR